MMARIAMNYRISFRVAGLIAAVACSLPLRAASDALPGGTQIQVRMIERISSETARPGDTFHGTLAQPVVSHGTTLFTKGTDVTGQVMQASSSGRLSSPGELQLVITSISGGWFRNYPVTVQPVVVNGGSHTKSNVAKIGGGAAAGTIIGAIVGGGKGAAIGAGVGAGTGTVVAASSGKREAVVESEALLTWTTVKNAAPLPSNHGQYPANSYRDNPDGRYNDRHGYGNNRDDRDDRDNDHHGYGYAKHRKDDDGDEDDDHDHRRSGGGYDRFSDHDRDVFSQCMSGEQDYSNLPPGLAKRDRLPPGLEKQVQRNGTLPPGLQKRVQPLPERCEVELPRLPRDWARVILSGRIILLGPEQRILDIFELRQ
jgi:hypothetical protein